MIDRSLRLQIETNRRDGLSMPDQGEGVDSCWEHKLNVSGNESSSLTGEKGPHRTGQSGIGKLLDPVRLLVLRQELVIDDLIPGWLFVYQALENH